MTYQPTVFREIDRADAADVVALGGFGTATVHEAYRRLGLMHGISAVVPGAPVSGTAVTCLNYPGDNLMLHAAIEVCRPGDVLIAAVTAPSVHGMLGELIATICKARGVAGVVLDSGARDVAELRAMGYPVYARGITALGTAKAGLGYVNTPVSCGSVVVFPGDAIVADDDGVVAVQRADVPRTLAAARRRAEHETEARARYAGGTLSLDTGTMRATLSRGEVAYADRA